MDLIRNNNNMYGYAWISVSPWVMLIRNSLQVDYLQGQNYLFNDLRIPSNNNSEPIFQECIKDYPCTNNDVCVDGYCDRVCVCNEECITGSKCTNDLQCGTLGGKPIGSCNAYSKGCLCPPPPVSWDTHDCTLTCV